MKLMYTANATADGGGRDGRVHAANGHLDLATARPAAIGGTGAGTNPEELFAAGYAACFLSAMHYVAGQAKQEIPGSSVEGHVSLGQDDAGHFMLGVRHIIRVPALPQAEAEALVAKAHGVCPYSNATRGNIEVAFETHGASA